jgi:hypothetical protein
MEIVNLSFHIMHLKKPYASSHQTGHLPKFSLCFQHSLFFLEPKTLAITNLRADSHAYPYICNDDCIPAFKMGYDPVVALLLQEALNLDRLQNFMASFEPAKHSCCIQYV